MQHENTRIYARSLELVELSRAVLDRLPTGYAFVADQLRRAALSVPLNFAEGYGKGSAREQRRYFHIARGSACEVAAIFDCAQRLGVIDPELHSRGKDCCDHLAAMLTRFRRQ